MAAKTDANARRVIEELAERTGVEARDVARVLDELRFTETIRTVEGATEAGTRDLSADGLRVSVRAGQGHLSL
jgi:hypothetical protein